MFIMKKILIIALILVIVIIAGYQGAKEYKEGAKEAIVIYG